MKETTLTKNDIKNGVTLPDGSSYNFSCLCRGNQEQIVIPAQIMRDEEACQVTAIGTYAFFGSKIKGELVFPEGLKRIGEGAFCMCDGLRGNLIFPDTIEKIRSFAFFRCTGLNGDLIIPNTVQHIGKMVFNKCAFSGRVSIPWQAMQRVARDYYRS